MTEKKQTQKKTYQFKAEVAKVLDIVINSLYTDREIFIRELISNAADALEKRRHYDLINGRDPDKEELLEISILVDKDKNTITFADNGIGMNREELVENLGRVAHSGAAEYLKKVAGSDQKDVNLIGQFGVGFYSAFMVADTVTVESCPVSNPNEGWRWLSSGSSRYSVEPTEKTGPGTTITLQLKSDAELFADDFQVKEIIKKYSNFVSFPIKVNDERINTIQAIWSRPQQDVKDEEYKEFFKFMTPSASDPLDWLHFSTDAPIDLKALLFISEENPEIAGFGRLETNVHLYSKRVLIQRQAKDLLPLWLRFLSGAVDSEDIPLNISRETMQDSALIRKINRVLTKRVLKHLKKMADKKPDLYIKFWQNHGQFIKEGIVTEFSDRDSLAELLRFESSMTDSGQLTSLAEYVERMPESQKEIYYLAGADRTSIESGPYFEVFQQRGIEVIYNYDPVDDFVMHHLAGYKDKKTVSADSEKLDLPDTAPKTADEKEKDNDKASPDEIKAVTNWIRSRLQDKVADVKASDRLVDSPMMLVNPDGAMTGAMQRLMESANKEFSMTAKRNLQFNPNHKIIQTLNTLRKENEEKATLVLEQLYDHAALDAGMTVETRSLVKRVTKIINTMLDNQTASEN
jgi:TNF receptor-associated protein 1